MPKKIFKGKVVSVKMQKACVVLVNVPKRHPVYKKSIKNTKRFRASYENTVQEGNTVLIEETRPMSKQITWKVIRILDGGLSKGDK